MVTRYCGHLVVRFIVLEATSQLRLLTPYFLRQVVSLNLSPKHDRCLEDRRSSFFPIIFASRMVGWTPVFLVWTQNLRLPEDYCTWKNYNFAFESVATEWGKLGFKLPHKVRLESALLCGLSDELSVTVTETVLCSYSASTRPTVLPQMFGVQARAIFKVLNDQSSVHPSCWKTLPGTKQTVKRTWTPDWPPPTWASSRLSRTEYPPT